MGLVDRFFTLQRINIAILAYKRGLDILSKNILFSLIQTPRRFMSSSSRSRQLYSLKKASNLRRSMKCYCEFVVLRVSNTVFLDNFI